MNILKDKFLVIGITSPSLIDNEVNQIVFGFESGFFDILHIRKPTLTKEEEEIFIQKIPNVYYDRIKLHDHFELIKKYKLMGAHLNSRNPEINFPVASLSKSCHSLSEIEVCNDFDYITLSPIFDSISKEGYTSNFQLSEIKPLIKGKNVVALGGVTPNSFNILKEAGFIGAAMLGFLWK